MTRIEKYTELSPMSDFALGARNNACLAGEMPECPVPALWGSEGLWSYDCGHACHESMSEYECVNGAYISDHSGTWYTHEVIYKYSAYS